MDINKLAKKIKVSMRIRHNALDKGIADNIRTALRDMGLRGISIPEEEDSLVDKACELYCKGQYDYLGKGAEFERRYEELRDSMSLCGDYHGKE